MDDLSLGSVEIDAGDEAPAATQAVQTADEDQTTADAPAAAAPA